MEGGSSNAGQQHPALMNGGVAAERPASSQSDSRPPSSEPLPTIEPRPIRKSRPEDVKRSQRFLAQIQSNMGNAGPLKTKRKQKVTPANGQLTFANLAEAIDRMKLANDDVCVTLADIRPFLLQNAGTFSEEEFASLSAAFCNSAMQQTNVYSIVELCVLLIEYKLFQDTMSACLKEAVSKFISEEEDVEQVDAIPDFLAQLLVARWPRRFNKAIEGCNLILYTVISVMIGWVQLINDVTQKDSELDGDEARLELFLRCTRGLYFFCMSGQRAIWLNFPELFDDIYKALKNILVSNLHISRPFKNSLLQLYSSLKKWSASNVPKYSSTSTQTVTAQYS